MKFPKFDNPKNNLIPLLLTGLGLLSLFFLASSLSTLDFSPGQEFKINDTGYNPLGSIFDNANWLVSICLSVLVVLIPLVIFLLASSRRAREMLKQNMRGVLIFYVLLILAQFLIPKNEGGIEGSEPPGISSTFRDSTEAITPRGDTSLFNPYYFPDIQSWQGYIFSFILIILMGFLVYIIYERNKQIENNLGKIALKALRDIKAGRQWEDSIIQCYIQMNDAISKKRSLDRKSSMTPREFAETLIASGLPSKPVHTLTHLFERARYGDRSSQSNEVSEATQCLTQISRALENIE
jgi:hypothetical protein